MKNYSEDEDLFYRGFSITQFSWRYRTIKYARENSKWDVTKIFVSQAMMAGGQVLKTCRELFHNYRAESKVLTPRKAIINTGLDGWQLKVVDWYNNWKLRNERSVLYLYGESRSGKTSFIEYFLFSNWDFNSFNLTK